jgi:hypothetical protein
MSFRIIILLKSGFTALVSVEIPLFVFQAGGLQPARNKNVEI